MLSHLKQSFKEISAHCNPLELEQASLRLIIGVFVFFFFLYWELTNSLTTQALVVFKILLIFELIAVAIFVAILRDVFKPVVRRVAGAWLDISTATALMAISNEAGTMLIAIDFWVIFGNGFRFGKKYLYHSQALALAGYILVINTNSFWDAHHLISYSFIIMLIILPAYVAKLISRLHDAIHKEEIERQKAAEANSAKTRFVANMSHEIRTPLNGIIGISTLFKSTPLNADQQDLLKTLENSSKLLLSLLNNVLDFTKIEERKLHIENAAISIEESIVDTIGIFKMQGNTKNLELNSSVPDQLPPILGDAVVLRQVLANLMGNAIKFTEAGSVTVSAILLEDNKKNVALRFEVVDTGVGIPEKKQHRVFESFTQADATTTRKFGGSGLGLTIAKDMVEAMGGELKFDSTEGVGTRFWFDLSLEKDLSAPTAVEQAPTDETTHDTLAASNARPLDILVCEDEITNQKIITRLLSLPGHHVSVVDSSEAMLDTLETRHFDLVITDLNMAGMSGIEALKLYRFTQPTDQKTRFILFTADVTLTTKQDANDAGFDGILTKPIEAATLFSTIEKTLSLQPGTANYWMDNVLNINKPVEIVSDLDEDNIALDLSALLELEKIGAGDDLFMHRLLKNYLADSLKMINKISAAVKEKRYGELQDHCHALKGNSLSVGAMQLSTSTEELSKISMETTTKDSQKLLSNVNADFSKLTIAIEDYLRRPEAASK